MFRHCLFVFALLSTPALAGDEPELTGQEFMMPSRNVACIKFDASNDGGLKLSDRLYCLRYEPELMVVILDENGATSGNTEGDQPFSSETPILKYGDNWFKDGFSCDSDPNGVVCSHSDYGAFRLSRKGFEKLR